MAFEADHADRPVSTGRRHGCLRATALRATQQAAGQAGRHRQPGRRGRDGRRGDCGESGARRLHVLRRGRAPHDRAELLSEARLQHHDRPGAADGDRQPAADPRRQPEARGRRRLQVVHDLAEGEPGQAELRIGRQRHLAPPRRRVVQAAEQDLHRAHPVPRRGSGTVGPDRRQRRHDVRRSRLVGAAHPRRSHQGARRCRAHARARLPERADLRRDGHAGLRGARPGTGSGASRARRRKSSTACTRRS